MHGNSRHVAAALLLLTTFLALPAGAMAQVRIEDPDRALSLTIGGWVQPRYELTLRDEAENLSSFYLRRVRLDVRGSVFSPAITFRVMPEFARTAAMRDAWVNYEFSRAIQVRFGQFQLPFQWHRQISDHQQHFVERGEPSETFGFLDGRDIGAMVFGQNEARTRAYSLGLFDGAGRNVQFSSSAGNVASLRVTAALLGTIPASETDFRRTERLALALGAGLQAANRSDLRRWDLGRSPAGNARADWVAGTADVSIRGYGASLAADAYLRAVEPDDAAVADYTGGGFMVSTGYALVPERLELVARYSLLREDLDVPATEAAQWGAGLNVYHRGTDFVTRLQYLHDTAVGATADTGRLILQVHLRF